MRSRSDSMSFVPRSRSASNSLLIRSRSVWNSDRSVSSAVLSSLWKRRFSSSRISSRACSMRCWFCVCSEASVPWTASSSFDWKSPSRSFTSLIVRSRRAASVASASSTRSVDRATCCVFALVAVSALLAFAVSELFDLVAISISRGRIIATGQTQRSTTKFARIVSEFSSRNS